MSAPEQAGLRTGEVAVEPLYEKGSSTICEAEYPKL